MITLIFVYDFKNVKELILTIFVVPIPKRFSKYFFLQTCILLLINQYSFSICKYKNYMWIVLKLFVVSKINKWFIILIIESCIFSNFSQNFIYPRELILTIFTKSPQQSFSHNSLFFFFFFSLILYYYKYKYKINRTRFVISLKLINGLLFQLSQNWIFVNIFYSLNVKVVLFSKFFL